MSTEVNREVAGVGERGEVVVIHFEDNVVNGSVQHTDRYVVRMGAFTMHETASKKDAEATAKSLVRGVKQSSQTALEVAEVEASGIELPSAPGPARARAGQR